MRSLLFFKGFSRRAVLSAVAQHTFEPLQQAGRCLDIWLSEEGRGMTPRQKQRAAALIARYFAHEEEVSDTLILSFLRHYSGFTAVDLDDPHAVRLELKAALDRASIDTPAGNSSVHLRPWLAAVTGMAVMATVLIVVFLSQQTLSLQQQADLRQAVAARAAAQQVPVATIWAALKRDLGVTRYQDIRRWDYKTAITSLLPET